MDVGGKVFFFLVLWIFELSGIGTECQYMLLLYGVHVAGRNGLVQVPILIAAMGYVN
jgi:hypothetical protein